MKRCKCGKRHRTPAWWPSDAGCIRDPYWKGVFWGFKREKKA